MQGKWFRIKRTCKVMLYKYNVDQERQIISMITSQNLDSGGLHHYIPVTPWPIPKATNVSTFSMQNTVQAVTEISLYCHLKTEKTFKAGVHQNVLTLDLG